MEELAKQSGEEIWKFCSQNNKDAVINYLADTLTDDYTKMRRMSPTFDAVYSKLDRLAFEKFALEVGRYLNKLEENEVEFDESMGHCLMCHGKGMVQNKTCQLCNGSGKRTCVLCGRDAEDNVCKRCQNDPASLL